MMNQISMFDSDVIPYPQTYADIDTLYTEYIFEGETDKDTFTFSGPKDNSDSWRSYFFYGKKVFSFYPDRGKGSKFKIVRDKKNILVKESELPSVLEELKQLKHVIFRNTIIEEFACCNDFKRCSSAGVCLYTKDRFYNGCYYRTNLEAGKVFFKE